MYPPLWGKHSYNDAAGLYQLSKLAGFIKNNMPNGVNYHAPSLSNQDAWNLAAYINAQPRPSKDKSKDFPIVATKPIDYPFGPYTDTFSEQQHKFGPFAPIALAKKISNIDSSILMTGYFPLVMKYFNKISPYYTSSLKAYLFTI